MNKTTLLEKYIKLYVNTPNLSEETEIRCIENYLNRKYSYKKTKRILDDLKANNDIDKLAIKYKKEKNLTKMLDKIVDYRIHNINSNNDKILLSSINDVTFVTLIKKILLDFSYEILYFPPLKTNNFDFIVYRNQVKITVFVVRRSLDKPITVEELENCKKIQDTLNCEKSIVFTNSTFTNAALKYSAKNDITAINHEKVNDLLYNKLKTAQSIEKEHLVKETQIKNKNNFFLEEDIKSKKTKVNVKEIKYIQDKKNNTLIFEGILQNIGKHPAQKLRINLRLYGRNRAPIFVFNEVIDDGYIKDSTEKSFKIEFNDITEFQWKDLCRYSIKLYYR